MLERYIVVATDKLPRGILYLGDLRTDASKRNSSVDPPAQTRYLTPPDNDLISIDAASGRLMQAARGIGAYIAARVQPGGTAALASTVAVAGVAPGDTLTVGTVVLTAATTEDEAKGWFLDSATATSDTLAAASLAKILQSATQQAALKAAIGAVLTASASGAVVTMSLPSGTTPPAVTASAATLTVAAFAAPAGTLPGPFAYDQASADILARVRAFGSMTLADVNAILGARLGGELTSAGGSSSAGSLTEFLSLLAGRTFELGAGTQLFSGGKWVGGSGAGSFQRPRKVYDAHMVQGMLVPYHLGGDDSPIDIGPARRTFPGSYFNASYLNGQLSRFMRGVQLRGSLVPERAVVIYDETGALV